MSSEDIAQLVDQEVLLTNPEVIPLSDSSDSESSFEDNNIANTQLTKATKFSITTFLASMSINLILPFINGLMLGFGELVAHEIGLKWGWFGAKVYRPQRTQVEEKRRTRLI